ncbi:MAG: hypothetical protein ACREJP_05330 [Candidatus Methylomirabilales bacterium]
MGRPEILASPPPRRGGRLAGGALLLVLLLVGGALLFARVGLPRSGAEGAPALGGAPEGRAPGAEQQGRASQAAAAQPIPWQQRAFQEVAAEMPSALDRFYGQLAKAMRELDPTPLQEVATGPALAMLTGEIEELRRLRQPLGFRYEYRITHPVAGHRPTGVVSVSVELRSSHQRVDPQLLQPVADPVVETGPMTYYFVQEGGRWLVKDIEDS